MKEKIISTVKTLGDVAAQAASGAPAAEQNGPEWAGQVAVLTGVLAALTGFLTVRSTMLTNEAIYESNQAILSQTQASDAWAEYQANSIKARIVEMQLIPSSGISPGDREDLTKMDKDLRGRQPGNKEEATAKTQERQAHLDMGLKKLKQKDLLGYAGMLAQIGIALASVAALVKRRSVFYAGVATGVGACVITAYVFASVYLAG
ncbi:MAG TPA: DUF4337 family protein [Rickettsiales bacterium]|nr:DUF4337 family protein [Rickettsiales bacterium]